MCKVSIIVPVYNVEKYLRRCLESLLCQSFDDYEILVINDSSPDNSQKIIDEYASKDSRIRSYKNFENLGLGLTRNRGTQEAKGSYIMFVDSDDYVAEDYIETYYNEMIIDDSIDVVVGGYYRDVNGKLSKHIQKDCVWSITTYTIACAKMFKKSFLELHDLYFTDIRMGEDVLFSMEAFCCGMNYRVMNYAGYYYYLNKDSITGTVKKNRNQERFVSDIYDRLMAKYDIRSLPKERYHVIEYTYLANMVNALVLYGKGASKEEMMEKRQYVWQDAQNRFPDFLKNPYIPLLAAKGQTLKIRIGVWGMITAYKMGIDRLILLVCR